MIYHETNVNGLRTMPNDCLQIYDPSGKKDPIIVQSTLANQLRAAWNTLERQVQLPEWAYNDRFDKIMHVFRTTVEGRVKSATSTPLRQPKLRYA